jgi:hypothetical protein
MTLKNLLFLLILFVLCKKDLTRIESYNKKIAFVSERGPGQNEKTESPLIRSFHFVQLRPIPSDATSSPGGPGRQEKTDSKDCPDLSGSAVADSKPPQKHPEIILL